MSIEFCAVEQTNAGNLASVVSEMLNDGWQVVSSHVTYVHHEAEYDRVLYTTFLQRDTAAATVHKNGVYLASLMEVLEKRVTEHDARLEVLETTADTDDELPADRIKVFDVHGTLIDLINPHTSQFIPLGNVYDEVVYGGIAEDEAREGGNHA